MQTPAPTRLTPSRRPIFWVGLLLWLLVIPAAMAAWQSLRAQMAPLPTLGPAPEFSLTDQQGDTYALADLVDHVTVVDFIFTRCPDVCPLMTTKMVWLQDQLDQQSDGSVPIEFVSISVDPEYDTPERLTAYGERYGVDSTRWALLTGTRAQADAVAAGFKQALEWNDSSGDSDIPDIRHSQKFILVDQFGMVRGFYDSDTEGLEQLEIDALYVARGPIARS